MKLSSVLALFCASLFLSLTVVGGIERVNTINNLKKLDFTHSVPKHSILLLYWFANTVYIDDNDVIRLTFDLNLGAYGSHHYGNYERLLPQLPRGHRYYTIGNLYQAQNDFPDYIRNPPNSVYRGTNLDRIIVRVRQHNTGYSPDDTVDQVYITQHYPNSNQGTGYDPSHTYQITSDLLRQLQVFSVEENQMDFLTDLREDFGSNISDGKLLNLKRIWGNLACLGLLIFMILEEKYSQHNDNVPTRKRKAPPPRLPPSDWTLDIPDRSDNVIDTIIAFSETLAQDKILVKVIAGPNGKAWIHWRDIPEERLTQRLMVQLFKDNNGQKSMFSKVINSSYGSVDTSVPLNTGLQARLHKTRVKYCFFRVVGDEIYRGNEFENPGKDLLHGYVAFLQLFAKDGKAGVRLFVHKHFTNRSSEFKKSWVAFYKNEQKSIQEYEWWQWQWVKKFQPVTIADQPYNVYEYYSGMKIAPGIQARFILRDDIVLAKSSFS
ncbi:uncharacterized protein LOC144208332 [Stigmatopora nigra]